MARTDTVNAANLTNEVRTVFPGANSGRSPGLIAAKDNTVLENLKTVIRTGVVGHVDVSIDAALAANGWEARDRVALRTPEALTSDARAAERRKQPFVGGTAPYGGGPSNY